MIQPGKSEGLTAKALPGIFIGENASREDLDGDLAFKPLVVGKVNHTHSAGPDLFTDAIMADGFADHWKKGRNKNVIRQSRRGQPGKGRRNSVATRPIVLEGREKVGIGYRPQELILLNQGGNSYPRG